MIYWLLDWLKRHFLGTPKAVGTGTSPFPPGLGPSRLLVLRHAEKTGQKDDPHLSEAGQRRAEKLAHFIPETFGPPGFLFAARTSKRSRRPVETLEPLAAALNLEIDARFDDDEIGALVDELTAAPRYSGKFGVIAWRHSDIPGLLARLGAPEGSYPAEWPDELYDTVIEVTYLSGGGAPQVRQIPQPF